MPPHKTAMSFIADDRKRAVTFANRKKGLMKKAQQLATRCDVPVAVVCAYPDGGAPEVWETKAGVLDRYRALPAEKRVGHTHLRYLEDNLGKENAKLARVRQDGPGALTPPDAELGEMTLEGLHELLESVDAALRATAERRKALGLPGDDDAVEPRGPTVPCTGGNFVGIMPDFKDGFLNPAMCDAFQRYNDGTIQPRYYNTGMNMMQPGYYNTGMNMMQSGYYSTGMNMTQPAAYDTKYIGGDAVHMDGYPLQMPANGNDYKPPGAFQPLNAIAQHGYGGFQCTGSSYVGNQMQVSGNGFPDLAMWRTAEPCNAIVPANRYPYMHMSGNRMDTPAAEYPGLVTGDNFLDTPAGLLDMGIGIGGNVMNYVDGYETGCSSNEFQCSGSSQNSSVIEELHYLSDVADGMRFRYDDTQLQLWQN